MPRVGSGHVVEERGAVPRRAGDDRGVRVLAVGVEQPRRVGLQVGDVGGGIHPGGACHVWGKMAA